MNSECGRLDAEAASLLAEIRVRKDAGTLKNRDRLEIPPQEMPAQDPAERRKNVSEVALGYGENQARLEAERCLSCKPGADGLEPCVRGCPVGVPIPRFLEEMRRGDFDAAIAVIKEANLLPAVCGRVCPQESQCQAECTLGKSLKSVEKAVSIGRLERFLADRERESGKRSLPSKKAPTGKKVAVVGSGPAGLTVAADTARAGHAVTVFEAFHRPGGVMVYGIPEFRLPKSIVSAEVENLRNLGVIFETNFLVGRTGTLEELRKEYDAIFIGAGAGLPKFLNIPGENLAGVSSANEYLTRANLMKAYDAGRAATPIYRSRVAAVVGGGNVAMDAARMALRLGAEEVHIIYRRTRDEMPARREEIEHAREEGVIFDFLRNPVRILGDGEGRVRGMELLVCELGKAGASGRRSPVAIPGSEYFFECDMVIPALGNEPNPLLARSAEGLETGRQGCVTVNGEQRTSLEGVYAGGDIVLGAATVILAMGEGRKAAAAINRLLK